MRRTSERGFTLVEVVVYAGLLMVFMSSLFMLFRRSRQVARAAHAHANRLQTAVCVRDIFGRDVRLSDGWQERFHGYRAGERTLILHRPSYVAGGERTIVYHCQGKELARQVFGADGQAESSRVLAAPSEARFRTSGSQVEISLTFARSRRRRARTLVFLAAARNVREP